MVKAININHNDASLTTHDKSFIQLSKNGAVKIGYGKNLSESTIDNIAQDTLMDYIGAMRINETTKKLEYCDGKSWITISTEEDVRQIPMVYSFLF